MTTAYAIGDVHGHLRPVQRVLEAAGLIDRRRRWSGGKASLVFLGDFVDRGPDGIGVIDLVMRLQAEAADHGGQVAAVLGNHDILLLAARWLGALPSGGPGGTFLADWLRNGGQPSDLERLSPAHVAWIAGLPAMLHWGKWLLVHADALVYQRYGTDVGSVNAAFRRLLQDAQPAPLDRLLDEFSERDTFRSRGGWRRAAQVLRRFGGQQLVHGHTPIASVTGQAPERVHAAYVYAGGRCANIDPGLYAGGQGFVHRLGHLVADGWTAADERAP